jgi:hypothetical protein
VFLRLAYLIAASAFAVLRPLPMTDREKDAEILVLWDQITVLERQLDGARLRFVGPDRALLAALLHRLPRGVLLRMRLLVRPDTVLRWHRDLIAGRHAAGSRPARPGRPPTVRSIRLLALRMVRENPSWGYRRVQGELLVLGVKVALPPPSGKSSRTLASTRHPSVPLPPGPAPCPRRPGRCWRVTSWRP